MDKSWVINVFHQLNFIQIFIMKMALILNPLKLFCLFLIINSYGQQKALEITFKHNDDKSIDFYYQKISPGSTLIVLNFSRLENCNSKRVIKKTVKGTSGSLLTLKPEDEKRGINFSYSYSYITGSSKPKINKEFKYLLPFKNGKEVLALDLHYLGKRFGNSAPKNWKSIQFLTNPNDTVYTSRKGVVVEIKNEFNEDNSSEFSYKKEANHILIEHKDGTLAKYGVLKRNSMMIKVGDKVYPNTPIAITGTYDKPENSQLRFEVYYLDKSNLDSFHLREKQTLANQKHYYAYLNPFFNTKSGVTQLNSEEKYTTSINDELIEFEMTKREKKKRGKK